MSLGRWPEKCPHCGGRDWHEVGRIEAKTWPSLEEDIAIYECYVCGEEFETRDLPEPVRQN